MCMCVCARARAHSLRVTLMCMQLAVLSNANNVEVNR